MSLIRRTGFSLAVATVVLTLETAQSQSIAWDPVVDFNDSTRLATSADVNNEGTTVLALQANSTSGSPIHGVVFSEATTQNGVTFSKTGSDSIYNEFVDPPVTIDGPDHVAYRSLLNGAWFGSSPTTITLSELTTGQSYLVQFWASDLRPYGNYRSTSIDMDAAEDSNNPTLVYLNSYRGATVVGRFIATGSSVSFTLTGGEEGAHFNAIQLRAIPPLAAATTTTLESSPPTSSALGDSVTFTARIKAGEVNVPSGMGTVEFKSDIDGVLLGAAAIAIIDGVATYSTSALSAVAHTITATYSGVTGTYLGSEATISQAVTTTPFGTWAYTNIKLKQPTADASATGDPDGDGSNNLFEYAFGGDPLSGGDNAKVFSQFKERGTAPNGKELILTVAVLDDAPALEFVLEGNSLTAMSTSGGITYRIEGSNNLVFPGGPEGQVSELIPAETTTAMMDLLPATGYVYRSFVLSAGGAPAKGFLRAVVEKP